MNRAIQEKYLKKTENYWAEAQYYLEVHEYDLEKAIQEFEADFKFEQEAEKNKKEKKKKKWIN